LLEDFFNSYVDAFLSFRPEPISGLYEFPAVFYTESGEVVVFDEKQFGLNSIELLRIYKSIGVDAIDYEIINTLDLSDALVLATTIWSFIRQDGSSIYRAKTNYVLRQSGGSYKIASVIMVNESTELAKVSDGKI